MIKISRNQNFAEWIDISCFGKIITNAKTEAKAIKLAMQIKREARKRYLQKLEIVNELNES
jgi:hypothetical protein